MKTFEEAIDIITDNIKNHNEVYVTNINDGVAYADNKNFKWLVKSLTKTLILELATVPPEEVSIRTLISARIHEIIQIGILIGTEMEKP